MSDHEGVQFGPMQSTPLPRNNPSIDDEEEDTTGVINPVITKKDSNDWKPDKPIMGVC